MSQPVKTVVALPAYNEAGNLPDLLARWKAVLEEVGTSYRIVVVNDGSTDGTANLLTELAAAQPLEVVTHACNQGLGRTITDALATAAGAADPDDVIVTMDADGTHPPELFPQMVEKLKGGAVDVVIASRYEPGARVVGLSLLRRVATWGAGVLYRVLLPIPRVRDYTCGYRAYRAGCVQDALARSDGVLCAESSFACMAEILLNLARAGARYAEVPLVLRYDAKLGKSKMNVTRTVWRTLKLIVRQRRLRRR